MGTELVFYPTEKTNPIARPTVLSLNDDALPDTLWVHGETLAFFR